MIRYPAAQIAEYEATRVPRCLARVARSLRPVLPAHNGAIALSTLLADRPNPSSRNLHSSEHCGGVCTEHSTAVRAVSPDRVGFCGGVVYSLETPRSSEARGRHQGA